MTHRRASPSASRRPAFVVMFVLLTALAMFALPWQIDAARMLGGHDTALAAHDAGSMGSHEPADEPERGSHEHGAECFWCVAVVGTLIGRSLAPTVAVTEPLERTASPAFVSERPAAHDAAPRAPPARAATRA